MSEMIPSPQKNQVLEAAVQSPFGALSGTLSMAALPTFSEFLALLSIVLNFSLRHFVPDYPSRIATPAILLWLIALSVPALTPARLSLFVIALIEVVLGVLRPIPYLNVWPLDLYLIAGVCFLFLRKRQNVDLSVRWSFRFSKAEWFSSIVITVLSVAVLTIYFHNNMDIAKTFPLPNLPAWSLPLLIVGLAIINALREELVYRLILQRTFQAYFTMFWSVMIQALAFGLLHFESGFPRGGIGVALTFLFGVLTGVQFLWSRSLALVWITHALTDACMFAILVVDGR